MRISIIVALDHKGVIGLDNALPWHLSDDLKNFKKITMGKPIVMGRKTHESIGKALPGRKNIVITRNQSYSAEGCHICNSLDEAEALCIKEQELIIIGGRAIYELGLVNAQRIYLTEVHADVMGNVFFPVFDRTEWDLLERVEYKANDKNGYDFTCSILQKQHELYW
jgi:dihydrofolate reductase